MQRLATAIGEAQSLADRYKLEGEQLRDKLRFLSNSDPSSVVCPLCLSSLSEDGCQRLSQNYEVEIEEKRELYRVNQRETERPGSTTEGIGVEPRSRRAAILGHLKPTPGRRRLG